MAWLRIDDRVRTHPKIVQAGPTAAWLWFCGICYCREHLTDGFLARGILPTLAPGLGGWKALAAKLVAAGLWHETDGGYTVHDFLEWNPTRASVLANRDQDRVRKRSGFQPDSSRNPDGFQPDSERTPSGFQTTPSRARAGDAGLGLYMGSSSGSSEGGTGETAPGRRALIVSAGTLPRDHRDCGWCGARFCVSAKTFTQMVRRYGTDGDAAVVDWLGAFEAGLRPDQGVGGPVWVLQHFDAWLVGQGRLAVAPVAAAAKLTPAERFRASQAAKGGAA